MIINQKLGNLSHLSPLSINIDILELEWHETNKRIINKRTVKGLDITLRFLKENQLLTEGDIVFNDFNNTIIISIKPCECLKIKPANMKEMAAIAYEIGNKHLPLFIDNEDLILPYDQPLMKQLNALGYTIEKVIAKLINPLRTTVSPHMDSNTSLFSKILKLTTA